jgi:SAM-dependent methyltransferase
MDPTQRFSDRVADYVRYRPSYPRPLLDVLTRAHALAPDSAVADIGSGTGLLTRLFLEQGHRVWGIEPNPEMRAAGEDQLREFPRFISVPAAAENTGLPPDSIDLVVAGQAFHWFDRARARVEFARILRGSQPVALVWNERLVDASPFLRDYEQFLRDHATDYAKVDHRHMTPEVIAAFFAPAPVQRFTLPNRQVLDFPGLRGRVLSSSYIPAPGHPGHDDMLIALRALFDRHAREGNVTLEYVTLAYLGRLRE